MTRILLLIGTSSTGPKNLFFFTCLPYKICTTRHDWTFGNGLAKVVSISLILSFTIGNRLNNTTLFIISGVQVSPNWTVALKACPSLLSSLWSLSEVLPYFFAYLRSSNQFLYIAFPSSFPLIYFLSRPFHSFRLLSSDYFSLLPS